MSDRVQDPEKALSAGAGAPIEGANLINAHQTQKEEHEHAEPEAHDPNLVDWASETDPLNPKNWTDARKWSSTLTLSACGLLAIMNASVMAPALPSIAADLDMSPVESQMSLSVYVLAIAFGPLILGPLSEIYGRLVIIHGCNIWFLVWSIACSTAQTKGALIAARLLAGFGGATTYSVGQGVLGDCWRPEQRGKSLAIYSFIPLLGSGIGPTIGAAVAAGTHSWRWIFYVMAMGNGAVAIIAFFAFKETHAATILHSKAKKMRKVSGNNELQTSFERLDHGKSPLKIIGRGLSRPIRLFFTHPIIPLISVYAAVNYGVLFLFLSTFADLWVTRYHQSVLISGLHYIALVIGEIAGTQIAAPLMDKLWQYLKARAGGNVAPEYRVPLFLPSALLVPAGLFWYGWSGEYGLFWLMPDIGAGLLGTGLMVATGAQSAYIVDAFPNHTASATAATSFLRSLCGFLFPLFAPKLYAELGFGWANSVLGFGVLFLGTVGPAIIWKWGAVLRARAQSSY